MIHSNTVNTNLIEVAQQLSAMPELNSFRLVGGTAIALQLGHRISIDIDFFSNEKINKGIISRAIVNAYPDVKIFQSQESIRTNIRGVRLELYDDWHVPFKNDPIVEENIRFASLKDLAAFKIEAIIGRREKKDYIDLHFIFKELGGIQVLNEFKNYNPNISGKSILFALGQVNEARDNKSVMPEMVTPIVWKEIENSILAVAKMYISQSEGNKDMPGF